MNKALDFIKVFITALVNDNKDPFKAKYKNACKKSLEEQTRLLAGYTFKLDTFESYYEDILMAVYQEKARLNRLGFPGPDWIKTAEDTFEHPQLLTFKGNRCQYTFDEARTIQNGWDIADFSKKEKLA